MSFELPDLPFIENALEPFISEQTVKIHHGKHHAGYVKKLNEAIKNTEFEDIESLETLIGQATGKIYDLAAQIWNHTFYWQGINPEARVPGSVTSEMLTNTFGSIDSFKAQFSEAAQNEFGSGWAWLVYNSHRDLEIHSTTDAVNPISQNDIPVLTLDVWEHAYYLDYQNARADYIKAYMEHLLNWDFVEQNLSAISPR